MVSQAINYLNPERGRKQGNKGKGYYTDSKQLIT